MFWQGLPSPTLPLSPGTWPLSPSPPVHRTQTPLLLPLRHGLCHQLVYLGLLVPRKDDVEGFVVCKGRGRQGSEPGRPVMAEPSGLP